MNFRQPAEALAQSPFILEDSVVNFDYPVHCDPPAIQILYITEFEGKILAALPHTAWHRMVSKRAFPATGFVKATLVEVISARLESRSSPDPEHKMRVWAGFLKPGQEKFVHADVADFRCDHFFGEIGDNPWMPYAQSLIDAAQDHFAFFSAGEGEAPGEEVENGSQFAENELLADVGSAGGLELRVRQLEDALQSVHASWA